MIISPCYRQGNGHREVCGFSEAAQTSSFLAKLEAGHGEDQRCPTEMERESRGSHMFSLKFPRSHTKKVETSEVDFNDIFYST